MGGVVRKGSRLVEITIRLKGAVASPWNDQRHLLKQSALLVANACKHCFHIGLGFTELLEGSVTLCAGLGVGAGSLRVVVAP